MNMLPEGVSGEMLGPPVEQVRYADKRDRQQWRHGFWMVVRELIISFPGTYDEVPWQYREVGADALAMND